MYMSEARLNYEPGKYTPTASEYSTLKAPTSPKKPLRKYFFGVLFAYYAFSSSYRNTVKSAIIVARDLKEVDITGRYAYQSIRHSESKILSISQTPFEMQHWIVL
ncbi:uncharacterized protein DFL_002035 [Arthrobotrys flagrans]|uniref:Uncharacterized protein n=1 Tax=Arthrobotrys flagrans TaxID=97331 RepID=A0A437AAC8_ARTFL|nr:hypothetical protein DFL_002035 [Arthrobotrys flagrans]